MKWTIVLLLTFYCYKATQSSGSGGSGSWDRPHSEPLSWDDGPEGSVLPGDVCKEGRMKRGMQRQASHGKSFKFQFIVMDIETTGFGKKAEIIQIGALPSKDDGNQQFGIYIIPRGDITPEASNVNHLYKRDGDLYLYDEKVTAVAPKKGLKKFMTFLKNYKKTEDDKIILVGHNSFSFSAPILIRNLLSVGFKYEKISRQVYGFVDSIKVFRTFFPGLPSYALQNLTIHFGIDGSGQHQAEEDAKDLKNLIDTGHAEANVELKEFLMKGFKSLHKIKYC